MATLTLDLPSRAHSTDAPSMADTLPSVNFNFEDLRQRMARFTERFDDFIEQGRRRVLEERNTFRMNIAELKEDQRLRKRDIEIAQLKQHTHSQNLAKEASESAEMRSAIATLSTHRDGVVQTRDALASELAQLQATLAARKEALARHARYVHSQSRWNVPELAFWEDYLCMRIEGAGVDDRLKFVYTHIDEREWERECWFELDTGEREYKVLRTGPKLERDEVEACVERLNESRELGPFFKGMREAFGRALK